MKKTLCILLVIALGFFCLSGCSPTPDTASPGASQTGEPSSTAASGNLKVHFIYVGQGDSEFIEFPDGQTMLIDAGPAEQGATVVNYIKKLGYSKIDYVVGTHPHTDHIGGLIDVLQSFDIGSMYMPSATASIKTYTDLMSLIQTKGIPLAVAKKDVVIKPGFATIIAPVNENSKDMNDNSAVVKITYDKTSFLFMGDASKNVEQELQDVAADVIKIGNHGSSYATSPEFIAKVNPKIAVITCGKSNKYKLPNPTTLKTLKNAGAKIYETSYNGTITVLSDGNTVTADSEPVPDKMLP